MHNKFVVYLVTYFGNKLPKFYLGSTTLVKINQGYFGSVRSLDYKKVWKEELSANPSLFDMNILSYHKTRKLALIEELRQQKLVNAPHNPEYVNKAFACVNGCFGVSKQSKYKGKSGNECPWFGSKMSTVSRNRQRKAKTGAKNPAACKYEIYDSNQNLKFSCIGNLVQNCIAAGIPSNVANKLKLTIKEGNVISNVRKGATGPSPNFDFSYLGWYARKLFLKKEQNKVHPNIGKIWVNNGKKNMLVYANEIPSGFCLGKKHHLKKPLNVDFTSGNPDDI